MNSHEAFLIMLYNYPKRIFYNLEEAIKYCEDRLKENEQESIVILQPNGENWITRWRSDCREKLEGDLGDE